MNTESLKINNIYLGDCYELIKRVPDKSIDLIITDPPYKMTSGGGGKSELSQRIQKTNYEDLKDIRGGFDLSILDEFVRVLKHIYIYIWCSKEQIPSYIEYFVNKKKCFFDILFWGKQNPTPATNNLFLNDVEYCLVFRETKTYFSKDYINKSKFFISPLNMDDKSDYEHPTIKPLELVKRHILNSTQENDIVLDPFLGSGTTAVACKHLNRNFIGIEIDENYYRIATDRLQGIKTNGETSLFDTDFEQLSLLGDDD